MWLIMIVFTIIVNAYNIWTMIKRNNLVCSELAWECTSFWKMLRLVSPSLMLLWIRWKYLPAYQQFYRLIRPPCPSTRGRLPGCWGGRCSGWGSRRYLLPRPEWEMMYWVCYWWSGKEIAVGIVSFYYFVEFFDFNCKLIKLIKDGFYLVINFKFLAGFLILFNLELIWKLGGFWQGREVPVKVAFLCLNIFT